MKSEAKTIINIIHTERIELENKQRQVVVDKDYDEVNKLQYQIDALEHISNKLYHIYEFISDEGFMEILTQNHNKYDTELVALNGNKYLVGKDEAVGIQENLLQWPEDIEDKTVFPPIKKAINLDNIIEINTIKED